MRSSSAPAGADRPMPTATAVPINIDRSFLDALVISLPPVGRYFPFSSGRRGSRFRCPAFLLTVSPLLYPLRNPHQPGWEIEDRQNVNPTQHILPPGNQCADIFTKAEHDCRSDRTADQRAGAA